MKQQETLKKRPKPKRVGFPTKTKNFKLTKMILKLVTYYVCSIADNAKSKNLATFLKGHGWPYILTLIDTCK